MTDRTESVSATEDVRIVHISDLHFGVNGQIAVWRSLRRYLNDEVKPHLVLVTGDIVNSPEDKRTFDDAKLELDQLQARGAATAADVYRVCPGNHDRHPSGIALGGLKGLFRRRTLAADAFDNVFGGLIARPETVSKFTLSAGGNTWRVRVVGVDSNEDSKYLAQGFVPQKKMDDLSTTLKNIDDSELTILLIHHHLLPIMELERSHQQLYNLLAPTVMINAGTILERLVQGNVNLVLHGHEHQRALARYGKFSSGWNDLVVLGAGSATGTKTGEGAEPSRASVNMIELRSDRTVWVREILNRASAWEISDRPATLLIDAYQIDRARFYRRGGSHSVATSQLVKCVEFHPDRDISITETRTNWAINKRTWQHPTMNSSGWLSPARIRIDWPQGGKDESNPVQPILDQADDHTYWYKVELPGKDLRLASRIEIGFRWFGGGILTEQDLNLLEPGKRGDFRAEGFEFAGVRVQDELEKLSLLVRIPSEFAPPDDSIEVSVFPEGGRATERRVDASLTRGLQYHAPGMFSLEVPYPTKGAVYAISWQPSRGVKPSSAALAFYKKAREPQRARDLLDAFRNCLGNHAPLAGATVGLYVPVDPQYVVLRRTAHYMPADFRGIEPPSEVSLRAADTLYRHASWGRMKIALKADDDNREYGFTTSERALAVIPICQFGRESDVPWGLLRVGLQISKSVEDSDLLDLLSQIPFADGVLSVLQAATQMR